MIIGELILNTFIPTLPINNNMLKEILIIGAGGGIGSICRYLTGLAFKTAAFSGTIVINIVGCFLIGILVGLELRQLTGTNFKLFMIVGFCGGFTTFSAFTLENYHLLEREKYLTALLYIGISVFVGLAATWLGLKITSPIK